MNFKIINYICLLAITFFCQYGFSETQSLEFKINGKKITIHLTDEGYEHIMLGKLEANTLKGGHDWDNYYNNYVKDDEAAQVYFDSINSTYIVSSKKGDSLDTIIGNLLAGKNSKYHTLFPSGILNKDFILEAFKDALMKSKKHIDPTRKLFYIQKENFHVAGYYEKKGNNYYIKSFFPDMEWYYKIQFKHTQDPMEMWRFFEYDPHGKSWIIHGLTPHAQLELTPYWPSPIGLIISTKGTQEKIRPETFLLQNKISAHCKNTFFPHRIEKLTLNFDIMTFFFDNPRLPTHNEVDDLLEVLYYFIPNFKAPTTEKNAPIKSIISIKKVIKIISEGKNLHFKKPNLEKPELSSSHIYNLDGKKNFANEILRWMLVFNTLSHVHDKKDATINLYKISNKFHRNFAAWLTSNPDADEELFRHDLVLDMSIRDNHYPAFPHSLTLMSITDVTFESLRASPQTQRILLAVGSVSENPFDLVFGKNSYKKY